MKGAEAGVAAEQEAGHGLGWTEESSGVKDWRWHCKTGLCGGLESMAWVLILSWRRQMARSVVLIMVSVAVSGGGRSTGWLELNMAKGCFG
ncbi:hypothetical protein M0R45_007161 [Rubus argutus]|uniref:Uncharacterized protein n=1 Tax=Rubus argutus TaxID=59490 RepID=A0AAW1YSJ4_RUBAR